MLRSEDLAVDDGDDVDDESVQIQEHLPSYRGKESGLVVQGSRNW